MPTYLRKKASSPSRPKMSKKKIYAKSEPTNRDIVIPSRKPDGDLIFGSVWLDEMIAARRDPVIGNGWYSECRLRINGRDEVEWLTDSGFWLFIGENSNTHFKFLLIEKLLLGSTDSTTDNSGGQQDANSRRKVEGA